MRSDVMKRFDAKNLRVMGNRSARVLMQLLTMGCVIAICGCTPSQRSVTAPVDLPTTFSASGDANVPSLWWTSFNDPGLDRAVAMAFEGSFTLSAAWDRLAQAEAVARSEGAALWPKLDAEGSVGRTQSEVGGARRDANRFLVGLAVSYEVDLWGRIRSAHDAAAIDVAASTQDVQAAAITLASSVATTWYELAEAEAQYRVIQKQTQTNQQVLDLIMERFRQGQILASDVLTQRRQVQSTQGLAILAQQRAAVLRHQLAALLGRPPKAQLGLPEPVLPDVGDLPATGVPAELMQRRPDVLSAMLDVLAQDRRVASAIAAQYPRLSLSAELQTSGAHTRDLFNDWLASLAANVVHPLFDAGKLEADADRQRASLAEAFHEYGQTVVTALGEVEDAIALEVHQRQYLANLQAQLATADRVIDQTRRNYLNGQLDYLRVLDALQARQALERTALTAQRQLIDYRIQLYRSLAGGLDLNRPAMPSPQAITARVPQPEITP